MEYRCSIYVSLSNDAYDVINKRQIEGTVIFVFFLSTNHFHLGVRLWLTYSMCIISMINYPLSYNVDIYTHRVRLDLKVFFLGVYLKVLTDRAYHDYRVTSTNTFLSFHKKEDEKKKKNGKREREREKEKKNEYCKIFRIKSAQLSTFSNRNFDVHCDHGHLR